ncbi:hypothetical protein M9435_004700 [Picochlorum sp. BPE23]|nr:hypothetical protein M9435_004700 [Picochlorum sp. BPE23]
MDLLLSRSDVRQFSVVEERTGGPSRSSLEGVSECVVEIAPSVMYEAGWGAGQGALIGVVREGQRVTEGGVACLHPLKSLHRSQISASSSLPSFSGRDVDKESVGDYFVYCTIWPSPKVKKGEVLCNSALVKGMFGQHRAVYDGGVALVVPQQQGVLEIDKRFDSCTISLCLGISQENDDEGGGSSLGTSRAAEGGSAGTPLTKEDTGSIFGGDKTPMLEATKAGAKKKKNTKKNTKSPQFVHMSPSMRRTLDSTTPQEKKSASATQEEKVVASPSHETSTGNNLSPSSQQTYNALIKRGKVMDMMLRSVIVRHLSTVGYIMAGNCYSFRFLDVPLAARIDVSSRADSAGDGCAIVYRFNASSDALTIQIESDENAAPNKSSSEDVGYAQDAVDAISEAHAHDDNNVSQTVFKSAYAGYTSLESLKGLNDITGLDEYVDVLRNWVSFPLKKYQEFCLQGAHPPTGVLLHGPPGTGKTLLARWIARDSGAKLFIINGSELMSEFLGESEKCLSAIFHAAVVLAPSIIFIDEIDTLGPSRETSIGLSNTATRLVATLAGALDSIHGHPVMVIGATNRIDSLDESLRRPSRLEKELEISVPSPRARLQILSTLLSNVNTRVDADEMLSLASRAHGFVGADLLSLCSEASMIALRRYVKNGDELVVTLADLETALYHTKPSALREFSSDIPSMTLADVGGHSELKQKLKEVVEWPIKFEKSLDKMGAVPPKGVLLCGPPGCSKTLLVKAIAGECRLNFFSVKGPELMSKYVGESEKAIAHIFEKARKASPSILFFDEIDGLVGSRVKQASNGVDVSERVLSQMLQEMDGIKGKDDKVVIIAATNRMDRLDKALLRPGRFDRVLHVSLPSDQDRREIFQIHLRHIPIDETVTLEFLVEKTHGYSGADIASLCQKAAMHALRTSGPHRCDRVSLKDFSAVLQI